MIELEKDGVFRVLGGILVFIGIFFDMVGFFGVFSPPEGNTSQDYLIILGFCTSTLVVPGIVLYAWGYKLGKKERELKKLASYVKSYRRIALSDIARKLGKTEYETEQIILNCIQKGLIVGYFDRNTGEFFTYQSLFQEVRRPDKCPNCGASMVTRVLSGEDAVCNYCGAHFTPLPLAGVQLQPQPYYPLQQYQPQQRPPPPQYQQPYPPYPQTAPARLSQPPRPSQGVAAAQTSVKCPSCKKIFDVRAQARPFRIACPFCRIEGIMK